MIVRERCRFGTIVVFGLLLHAVPTHSSMAQEASSDVSTELVIPGDVSNMNSDSPFEGIVFYCTNCKNEVPESKGAGSTCPHCGAYFNSATNADGTKSSVEPPDEGLFYSIRFWGVVLLVLIFGGEYAYKKWRRHRSMSA